MVDFGGIRCPPPTGLVVLSVSILLLLISLPMVFWPLATRILPLPVLSTGTMASSAKYSMVFVTAPKKEVADKLADGLGNIIRRNNPSKFLIMPNYSQQ